MIEMHCGMCEHDWLGDADSYLCPACGSNETELLSGARTHNEVVQFAITKAAAAATMANIRAGLTYDVVKCAWVAPEDLTIKPRRPPK